MTTASPKPPPGNIVQITVENIKRVKAVNITPDGNLVQITGANAQGKSSVLDAFEMAIGGKDYVPAEPIRRGESMGRVVLKTVDFTVERRFMRDKNDPSIEKTTLVVRNNEGVTQKSPQELLNRLFGTRSVDPVAFIRMKPADQLATLKALAKLDFTDLDNNRREVYEQRTFVNRDLDRARKTLETIPLATDAPTAPVDVAELLKNRQLLERQAKRNAELRAEHSGAIDKMVQVQNRMSLLRSELQSLELDAQKLQEEIIRLDGMAGTIVDPSFDEIDSEIAGAGEANRKLDQNRRHKDAVAAVEELSGKSDALTEMIAAIDEEKKSLVANAELPVDGLGFGDEGITYNGIPFEQASQAEQLRVSTAIGLRNEAENKIILIRDGSLLDSHNMAMLAEMAAEVNALVLVERVDETGEIGLYIEDGMSK